MPLFSGSCATFSELFEIFQGLMKFFQTPMNYELIQTPTFFFSPEFLALKFQLYFKEGNTLFSLALRTGLRVQDSLNANFISNSSV